jgi:UDP-GlcNAc:undecaprenyl-phosphate GlcNAc-1-phosphate transferase
VTTALAALAAFVLAVALTPLMGRLAVRLGVVDHPGPLKVQQRPMPYLGGLAVMPALALGAGARPWFLLPLGLAAALGVTEDRVDLPVAVRLVGQAMVAASAAVAVGGADGWGAGAAAGGATFVLVNAVNLIDGLDGLASAVAGIGAVGFAVVLHGDGRVFAATTAAAAAGFLVHNRPPARIYLGDGGSYVLGTALALLLSQAVATGRGSVAVGAVPFVCLPLVDTAVTVVRRFRAHRPLFLGDRGHVYDRMTDRGWSVARVTSTAGATQAGLTVLGAGAAQLDAVPAAAVVAGGLVALATLLVVGGYLSPVYRRHVAT